MSTASINNWFGCGGCRYIILPMPQTPTARSISADQAIELFCQLRSCQRADFPVRGPFGGTGR